MISWNQARASAGCPEIGRTKGLKATPRTLFCVLLTVLLPILSGCEGPKPYQTGLICCNLTFSVAVYSWLVLSLMSVVCGKLGRDSIPQRLHLYQLAVAVVISVGLSLFLSATPWHTFPVFSRSPLEEWWWLQFYSFLFLPFIAGYVLLAYLITMPSTMRKYRQYSLAVVVAIHWLFCAHFFLLR